jgi:hypothetical protein
MSAFGSRALGSLGYGGGRTSASSGGAVNTAPSASISSPTSGSTASFGNTVTFTGTASDAQDGTLSGASLVWTSSLDGAIGTGASFTKSNLTLGSHTITLTATDSGGLTGTASVSLTVSAASSSPYVGAGTDGTNPGVDWPAYSAQIAVAKSGDRRGVTRTLYSGTFEGANYPATWNDLTPATRTGIQRFVTAGSAASLQAAINAANLGDEIVIPAGLANIIVTSGPIYLPVKAGADTAPGGNNVVTIRTSTADSSLPAGVRVVGPSQALRTGLTATNRNLLAHIQSSGTVTDAVFDTGTPSGVVAGYHFIGLEITSNPALTGIGASTVPISRIVRFGTGDASQSSDTVTPKNLVLDRCYVHAWANQQVLHAVDLQSSQCVIKECDISEIKEYQNGDCQALLCYNSNGKNAYINTYFEATDEGLVDGGGDNNVGSLQDLEHRWCVFGKQDAWNPDSPSYAGQRYSIKLGAEIKRGVRSLWEGCWFIGSWPDGQNGDGINIKTQYFDAGGLHTSDVILKYNLFEKLGSCIRAMGAVDPTDNYAVRRIVAAHNVAKSIGGPVYDPANGAGYFLQTQSSYDVRAVHNTAFPSKLIHYLLIGGGLDSDGTNVRVVHRDNIYGGPTSYSSFKAASATAGAASFTDTTFGAAKDGTVHGNVLVSDSSSLYPGANFSGNFFPAANTNVGFVDLAGGNFALASAASGTASQLIAGTAPSNGVSGTALATQPSFTVADSSGATVTGDTSTVTVALIAVSGTGTAIGTLTKVAAAGVANFAGNGLGVTSAAGGTFKWRATDGSLTSVDSATFTITPASVATSLGVVTQPSDGATGVALPTQPAFEIRDQFSARLTTDTSTVTVALVVVTGSGTAIGTLTKVAAAGLASFAGNGLGVTTTGGGTFKWRATDGALTLADSAVFAVSGPVVAPGGSTGGGGNVRSHIIRHKHPFGF